MPICFYLIKYFNIIFIVTYIQNQAKDNTNSSLIFTETGD